MNTNSTNAVPSCPYCGNLHQTVCPMVKAIEYHPDGVSVKRVEFKTAMDYPQSHVFVPGATPDLRFNPGQGLPFHPGQSYGPIGMGSVATTRTQQFQDEAAVTPQVQG